MDLAIEQELKAERALAAWRALVLIGVFVAACNPNVPPKKVECVGCNGTSCGDAGECNSGYCADGVCCDTACAGECDRCDLAAKPGFCGPATGEAAACSPYLCNGVDNSCPTSCSPDAGCFSTHFCSGNSCVPKLTAGTTCGDPNECASGYCADGVCCNAACAGACDRCDSAGTCAPLSKGAPGCGTFVCDGVNGACPTSCTGDGDCAAGNFCGPGNACVPVLAGGSTCSGDAQCVSAHCADAVCCDTACDQPCDRCDNAAAKGTCGLAPKGATAPACGGFLCGGSAVSCPATCATNADCAAGSACSGMACLTDGDRDGVADLDDCAANDPAKSTLRNCYGDLDRDGFVSAAPQATCSGTACPTGTTSAPGPDCDDSDAGVYQLLSCAFGADLDSDGYHANAPTPTCAGASCPDAGSSLQDCDDQNANAKPGQRFYFTAARDGGSYDWDCSGAEEKDPAWNCVTGYSGVAMCTGISTQYSAARGFVGASPGCGDAGFFRTCASWENGSCTSGTYWYGACGNGCIFVDGGTSFSVEEATRVMGCH